MPGPISEQEEFEFRLRAEQEGQKDSSPGFVGPTISQVTDTSPVPLKDQATKTMEGEPGLGLTDSGAVGRNYSSQEIKNAAEGVNIYKGLPSALRWQLPFLNKMDKVDQIRQSGRPTRIQDGDIQWWDSSTHRWTPTDSSDIEAADFGGDVAGSSPVVLSTLATAATAYLTDNPWAAGAASAVATGVGEFINQKIGQAIGIHKDENHPLSEGMSEAGQAAGIDAGFSVAMIGGTGLSKAFRHIFYPGGFIEKAPEILAKIDPEKVELSSYITALSGKQNKPTLAQITGDEFLLQLQRSAEKHTQLSVAFGEQQGETKESLEGALTALNDFRTKYASDYERDAAIRDSIKQDLDKQLTAAQTADATARRKAGEDVEAIVPKANEKQIGASLKSSTQEPYTKLTEEVDAAYDKVAEMTRYDPVTGRSAIPPLRIDKELRAYWSSLSRASKETTVGDRAYYDKLKKGRIEDILQGKIGVQKSGRPSDEYLETSIPALPDGTPMGNAAGGFPGSTTERPYGVYNSGGPYDSSVTRTQLPGTEEYSMPGIDINQLNEDIKLRRYDAQSKEGVPSHLLEEHISQLEAFRARALKDRPEVLEAIKHAEALRTKQATEFDDTLISKMFEVDRDGKYVIADKEAFALIFNPKNTIGVGDRAFGHFANIVKDDPQAKQSVREGFQTVYNTTVLDPTTMLPKSKEAHEAFMKEYEDRLPLFFNENEIRKINDIGDTVGIDSVVGKSAKRLESFTKELNESIPGQLGRVHNPEAITTVLMKKGVDSPTVKDIENTVRTVEKYGHLEELQKSTSKWIENAITKSNPKDPFSLTGFDKVLDSELRPRLDRIMGPQYMENLSKLRQSLDITKVKSEVAPRPGSDSGTLLGIIRSLIIGPLSREGRVMTQLRAGAKTRGAEIVGKVLLDHTGEELRKLVQMERGALSREAALRFLVNIGGADVAAKWVEENKANEQSTQ